MIDYVRYRFRLFKLRWQESHVWKVHTEKLESFRQEGKPQIEVENLLQGNYFELDIVREEIRILATDFLESQAYKRFFPLPKYDDAKMWEKCRTITNRKVLTNLGITTVKSALLNDRKERVDLLVKVLVTVIGILGALTGLFAVILR